ncbi:MAG: hypothetical protein J7K21_01120 [Desulfurococcales archaeon]|nr:hypothetical protein [Desulfurococcales archaeon]
MPFGVEALKEIVKKDMKVNEGYLGVIDYLRGGVDTYFTAVRWSGGYAKFEAIPPSEHWSLPELNPGADGELKCSAIYDELLIRSLRIYKYPYALFNTKLPELQNGQKVEFGFENLSKRYTGTSQFQFRRVNDVDQLRAYIASQNESTNVDISFALPTDAKTAKHVYAIRMGKNLVEFFVDGKVVAVGIGGCGINAIIEGPPYSIMCKKAPLSPFVVLQIEVYPYRISDILFPLNPLNIVVTDGDPLPPRVYRLYVAGTDNVLAGYSVSSGSVTTHPVPVFGHRDKTIYFMSDKDGQLSIEIYTSSGNWREYDSITVTANKLIPYKMTGDAVLVRLVFTPSTYPATVLEGEVVLGGG